MHRKLPLLPIFSLLLLLGQIATADPPPILTLGRPPVHNSPIMQLPAQSYPYGYFGAHGSTRWQRQFGSYRNYTQWSQR